MERIFWIAGDSSGDLHASGVLGKLKKMDLHFESVGIGGPYMQTEGLKAMFPFSRFNVMGFTAVLRHLPFFAKVKNTIQRYFQESRPDLVVLVDYPGFNMRIARIATDMRIPVLWYIAPQFWAWKHGRIYQLRDFTRHVACILPFEKEMLDIHHLNSSYVGHPIAEEIAIQANRDTFARTFDIDPEKKWIGFFPGSRNAEVKRMLPVYLDAAAHFTGEEYQVLVSKASSVDHRLFTDILNKKRKCDITVVDGYNYAMMKECEVMAVTSGTATIEAAYIGTPFVICYKASHLEYEIARRMIRVKRIGLPNIILERDVLPELIQKEASGRNIADQMKRFLDDPPFRKQVSIALNELHHLLGDLSASEETAKLVIKLLKEGY